VRRPAGRLLLLFIMLAGLIWLLLPHYAAREAARMNAVYPVSLPTLPADAVALHQRLLVADLHADPLLWNRNWSGSGSGHIDLPRLQQGNVALQVLGLVTASPAGQNYSHNRDRLDRITLLAIAQHWPHATWTNRLQRAHFQIDQLDELISDGSPLLKITTRRDLRSLQSLRLAGNRQIGVLLGLEGSHPLNGQPSQLDGLYERGLRMLGLSHFFDNDFAGSAHGEQQPGLSRQGYDLVRRAQALGMVIDLAHISASAFDDVLAISIAPLVVSHTGLAAVCPGARNLSDEQLRAVAKTGGVVGIALFSQATCSKDLSGFIRTIQHGIATAGIHHIALGSDFDGAVSTPIDAGQWAWITLELLALDLSEEQVGMIMGGNVIRVLEHTLPE